MLKVEGEQVRTWRDQCEALEARVKEAEAAAATKLEAERALTAEANANLIAARSTAAAATVTEPEVKKVSGTTAVQAVVPRLLSAHYKQKLQRTQGELKSTQGELRSTQGELRSFTAALRAREEELHHLTSAYNVAVTSHSAYAADLHSHIQAKQAEMDALTSTHSSHVFALQDQVAYHQSLLLTTGAMNAELSAFVESVKPQLVDLKLSATLIAGYKGDYLHGGRTRRC